MLITIIFPLYNIVCGIVPFVIVCVDFVGTHMAGLSLFFKIRYYIIATTAKVAIVKS